MSLISVDAHAFRERINEVPFAFEHQLHHLPLFSVDRLRALMQRWRSSGGSGSAVGPYMWYSLSPAIWKKKERHYLRGSVDIGHVDLHDCADKKEFLFPLRPGSGMHQPMNCPHWVQTQGELSISYSFSIETKRTRAMARSRAFNALLRRLGSVPRRPGQQPIADAVKASAMLVVRPLVSGAQALRRAAPA